MSNFMGPMAPPPAAPAQPQALDFQTDPNQRQRFKQFMQQRMQSPMPQMPAPMPMAPAAQPMSTVPAGSYILPEMDIFAPQQFIDGGIVGGLNSLGEMSNQMVEALNQVVYGGDSMGGGFGGDMPSEPSGPASMGGGSAANTVDQGFYGSPEYTAYSGGQQLGTQDMYNSPYFGQMGSGSLGRGQDKAYEDYLMRTGQGNLISTTNYTNPQYLTGNIASGSDIFNIAPAYDYGQDVTNMTNQMNSQAQQFAADAAERSTAMPDVSYTPPTPPSLGDRVKNVGRRFRDIFKFEDGGEVPPRETDIRGQYHELSYITPDEADILMALGGSGEPGPMGIPQYGFGDNDGSEGYGDGDSDTGGMGSGDSDTGSGGRDDDSNGGGWSDDDYRGYQEEDEQQQTVDMGNYEKDFGGDSPEGYSISDILADNAAAEAAEAAAQEAANRAQIEQAIKSGTLTSELTGKPVMSKSGPVMAGTKEEQKAAKEAYNQLQSGILGGQIESSGTTGTSNANKAGLLNANLDLVDDIVTTDPMSSAAIDKTAAAATGLTGKNLDAVIGYDKYGAPVMSGAAYGKDVDLTDQERALGNFMSQTVEATDPNNTGKVTRISNVDGKLTAQDVTNTGRPSRNMLQDIEAQMSSAIDRQTLEQSGALDDLGIFSDALFGVGYAKAADEALGAAEDMRKSAAAERLTDIVESGHYGVTDAKTGQLVGTVDPTGGIFGTGTYSGRPGYDPFASGNTLDPETNSYTVTNDSGYDRSDGGDSSVSSGGGAPEAPKEPVFDPLFEVLPPLPVDPGPVLVDSNRQPVPSNLQGPVGYGTSQTGQINPYSLSEMQRYQQMLARLNRPRSPIGLADGGSVLDAAAGRFLESLTAA